MKNTLMLALLGLSGCFASDPVAVVPTEQEIAEQRATKLDAHIEETQARVVRTQELIDKAKEQGVQNDIDNADIRPVLMLNPMILEGIGYYQEPHAD